MGMISRTQFVCCIRSGVLLCASHTRWGGSFCLVRLEHFLYAADRTHEVCSLVRQVNGLGVLAGSDIL